MSDSPDLSDSAVSAPSDGVTAPSASPPPFPADWHYESTVTEIETIIHRIEMGDLELAEVFRQFSTAVEQLHQCESFLLRQQHQVELLIETLLDEPENF
jgi:exodeoxyribonuclease VII small subunit